MYKLYQWEFGWQPHYVIATSYAHAEALVREKYGHESRRIDCVTQHVLLPDGFTRTGESTDG